MQRSTGRRSTQTTPARVFASWLLGSWNAAFVLSSFRPHKVSETFFGSCVALYIYIYIYIYIFFFVRYRGGAPQGLEQVANSRRMGPHQ